MRLTVITMLAGLTTGLAVPPSAGGEPDAAGPVLSLAFESFNKNLVRDVSAKFNHGVASGAVTVAPGKYGNALAFGGNGTASLLTIGDDASLDLTSGLTLEAWVYPTGPLPRWPTIIMKEQEGQLVYVLYGNADTNQPDTHLYIAGALRDARGTSQIPQNTWTHLAATYDGVTIRLYVNGVQAGTRPFAGAVATSGGPLQIGGNHIWTDENFTGRIDEVRIYDRALSAAEINADMTTPIVEPPADLAVEGQWSAKKDWPYVAIHATLMKNGKVLSWNNNSNYDIGQGMVWDPLTDAVSLVDPGPTNVFCAGHAVMPDGKVLVAGGHFDAYSGERDANQFDSATNMFQTLPPMSYIRWYPTVTALPDGRMLVVSGNTTCRTCWADRPEIYDPIANTWTTLTGAQRVVPFYPHTFVLPSGKLLVTGSQLQPVETLLLDVAAQSWTVLDPLPRDGGTSVMYQLGKVLKSGMAYNPDDPPVEASSTAWVIDTNVASPQWRAVAPMRFPRTQHTLLNLPDGTILSSGGGRNTDVFDEDNAVLQPELWSPQTEQWSVLAPMQTPRMYHSTALLLPDGRVLASGSGGFGPDQPSAEVFSPPYMFKGPRPAIAAAPLVIVNGTKFTVATPDAASIAKATLLRLGSTTHAFNTDQRYMELPLQKVNGGLHLDAPATWNIAPPGHYMLFLVNSAGAVSTAQIVRVPRSGEAVIGEASASSGGGAPFRIKKGTGGFQLTWSAPPAGPAPTRYKLYRTALGAAINPVCEADLGTGTSATLSTLTSNVGFLVVARSGSGEGSYGRDSAGYERPFANGAAVCP